jgi:hypothetical protein
MIVAVRLCHMRVLALPLLISLTAQAGGTISIDEVLSGIKQGEEKLHELRVEGKSLSLIWDPNTREWQYNGECEATAWFEGGPEGKMRVDIHKDIAPVIGGKFPFLMRSWTAAYNGRIGQVLITQQGAANEPDKIMNGSIGVERPRFFTYEATGWLMSLYGCRELPKMRLSEYVERHLELGRKQSSAECWTKSVRFGDADCIELVVRERLPNGDQNQETWYLDPARSYAPVFFEESASRFQATVDKLAEVAPKVFYPLKVTALTKDPSGQFKTKTTYEASSVVANDPNFRDDIFTIQWPVGTVVHDKISGITFTVGQSASDVDKAIADQVKRLKAAVRHPLTPQVKQSGGYWIPARWLAAIAVAAVAVAWLGWWARKQRK